MKVSSFFRILAFCLVFCSGLQAQQKMISWQDLVKLPPRPADKKIFYGKDSLQFGELRLPPGKDKAPVVILIHGGCWLAQYNLKYMSHMAEALTKAGYATWSLEFRRIGNPGGGWPGTFQDIAQGTDFLRELAKQYPLDLDQVVVTGHSAGGHLALWVAGRSKISKASPLYTAQPLPIHAVVALAAITDLAVYGAGNGSCNASVPQLMGGGPGEVADRYADASPIQLLPLGVPQRLLQGKLDPIVPVEQSKSYTDKAAALGDNAEQWLLEDAGHFDLVAPFSPLWPTVEKAFSSVLPINKADSKGKKKNAAKK